MNQSQAIVITASSMNSPRCKLRTMKNLSTNSLTIGASSGSTRAIWIWMSNSITVSRLVLQEAEQPKAMWAPWGKIQKECTLMKEAKCRGRDLQKGTGERSKLTKARRRCIRTPTPTVRRMSIARYSTRCLRIICIRVASIRSRIAPVSTWARPRHRSSTQPKARSELWNPRSKTNDLWLLKEVRGKRQPMRRTTLPPTSSAKILRTPLACLPQRSSLH